MTMTTETSSVARRIVVGVDGSEPSRQALRWARFLAETTGAEIEAVAAWQPLATWSGGWATVPVEWDPAADTEKMLHATLAEVFPDPAPAVRITIERGTAAKVLLDAGVGADVLVVGSRGRGGFAGLLLGSVSTACAEHATCPVLVIHGDTPPPPAPTAAASSS